MGPPVHQELLRRVASWIVRWRLSSLQRRPPALPGGAELRLEASDDPVWQGALGLAVWPAAPPLCRHLLRRSGGCMAGERVLELGSGTGVVGLFAAALGAATVLTDCRPAGPRGAAVLERLRSNAEANAALCAVAPELLELEWGHHEQQQAVASRGPFSLLLGSDVTYRPASHAALLAAAARVCECPEVLAARWDRRWTTPPWRAGRPRGGAAGRRLTPAAAAAGAPLLGHGAALDAGPARRPARAPAEDRARRGLVLRGGGS
ncbi:unnamed protein product [Prorocentrum cordatum]|uniref:Calmodulin-lysine N-methyltransferase n=1 Tax=Prorocentrum cordatum TaxID=2364126 RepID=A0ABN9UYK6_9DINO|nr:unnamed protein product [Polarella glacialis]